MLKLALNEVIHKLDIIYMFAHSFMYLELEGK